MSDGRSSRIRNCKRTCPDAAGLGAANQPQTCILLPTPLGLSMHFSRVKFAAEQNIMMVSHCAPTRHASFIRRIVVMWTPFEVVHGRRKNARTAYSVTAFMPDLKGTGPAQLIPN